ncbi:50S ribosomal protein L23, partial [Candidatus Azambacteria bacterium RIFCSPHIGHO2_02_FULL_45_18]
VTEKASLAGSLGRYIFRVPASANKIDVAREVRRVYKVKAVSVNLINVPGKERRVGRTVGFRPGYRKAIIKLAKGQTIELK